MDIHDNHVKQIPDTLPLTVQEYVFADQFDAFDTNLTSTTVYDPSPDSNSNTHHAAIAPFHAIAPNYNEIAQQNSDISMVPSEDSNNCITYSNVIFMPTIANDENQLHQIAVDPIGLVKTETDPLATETSDPQSLKYILSSDPQFVNFIQTSDIENPSVVLNNDQTDAYIEQPSQMIAAISQINENNMDGISEQIHPQLHAEPIDQNQMAVQMHSANEQEVLLQDEHGQLYRRVQNIYVDSSSMCSGELLPIINPVNIPDVEYTQQHMESIQNAYQKENEAPYQIPVNFIGSSGSSENATNATNDNLDMQQVEFIFNSYSDTRSIGNTSQSGAIDPNQYVITPNSGILADKQNYSTHHEMQTNKEQQRILHESTMSSLLAAVNDIAARELEAAREEQFQSYLNQTPTKTVPNQNQNQINNYNYYSNSHVNNMQPPIYTNASTTKLSQNAKDPSKTLTLATITNDLFPSGCDSSTDEYVDINDLEFIEKNNEEGDSDKSILMRRSQRKKTTKHKDDDLLVVDKIVPSRAFATLPTSYLYFENVNSDGFDRQKQKVFAKRDIPLQMKFGPFVGDAIIQSRNEIKKYRESHADYPLLFLSYNAILDVTNENTSNWMRFVRLALKHSEQNLLLCEIDSQLYFKCCKFIAPKQELLVGYSKEYAKKHNLTQLLPEQPEQSPEFLCKNCDAQFDSNELLQAHQIEHKTKERKMGLPSVPRTTPSKNSETSSPTKGKDRLNTGAIRMRKLALSKHSRTSGPTVRYACCYCTKVFSKYTVYKKHTNLVHSVNIEQKRVTVDAQHKRLTIEDSVVEVESIKNDNVDAKQWLVCQACQQHFLTAKELKDHQVHTCNNGGSSEFQCHICLKQLQASSALIMHIKAHNSGNGLCKCPFCSKQYQSTTKFKEHVKTHMVHGTYKCPHCDKDFPKYSSIRKHIRINHTADRFVCHECGKDFKSKYKLKEHSLSHSDVREFSCDDCDKQFKRKDKLRDHILKFHAKNVPNDRKKPKNLPKKRKKSKTRKVKAKIKCETVEVLVEDIPKDEIPMLTEEVDDDLDDFKSIEQDEPEEDELEDPPAKPKFQPKVPPTDYERFIYKCNHCMLGFKRRGMLVNHMAKRHPDIQMESIRELNLPILKTERCFYCQYCEKVYKSSSKRKAHILKYHPGQKLPQSMRKMRDRTENCNDLGEQDESFSTSIGSITTIAHQCTWCYKQYASRSRLLKHRRTDHTKELEETYQQKQNDYFKELNMIMDSHESQFQSAQVHLHHNMDEYAMRYNEMNENEPQPMHRFHHIEYEPENRLLELSSAALEASIRDDYSFLSDSDVHTDVIGQDIMDTRVDVNFKCDSNTLPQLFEEIDYMTLKPTQFSSSSSTQINYNK